jgi:hypothetical protein
MNYPMTKGKAMLKKTLNCVISLFLPWCTLTLNGQTDLPRFETAGQFGLMYTGYRDVGVGGRFSFNASEMLALEATVDHFPQDRFAEGKKTLALFGVKIGPRTDSAGIFTAIRSGFVKFNNEFVGGNGCDTLNLTTDCFASRNHFALDIGGGFEVFPNQRTVFRFDIGNLLIRFPGQNSNNLIMTVGFGLRF